MRLPRQSLIGAAFVLWGFAVMLAVVLVFFPYQKALKIVSQNLLGSSRMVIALENPRFGFAGAQVSRIVVGHVAVEGGPLFEFRKIDMRWRPFSLLTGKLAILCKATAYDGTVDCSIDGISVSGTGSPFMNVTFKNVNLAKYPERVLPWFRGMSGSMSGWIKKEISLERSGKPKGSFRISMAAGEIKEVQIKGLQSFVLPYKKVTVEGRITGSKTYVDKIVAEGDGIKLEGNGTIEEAEDAEARINLTLTCRNGSEASPLPNGSVIKVTGNKWSPTVTISTEPAQQTEKVAARNSGGPII